MPASYDLIRQQRVRSSSRFVFVGVTQRVVDSRQRDWKPGVRTTDFLYLKALFEPVFTFVVTYIYNEFQS